MQNPHLQQRRGSPFLCDTYSSVPTDYSPLSLIMNGITGHGRDHVQLLDEAMHTPGVRSFLSISYIILQTVTDRTTWPIF